MITDPRAGHIVAGRLGGKPGADQPEHAGQAPEETARSQHHDGWALLNMSAADLAALEQDFPSFQIGGRSRVTGSASLPGAGLPGHTRTHWLQRI